MFADADREVALDMALTAVFLHSGQVCSAGARLVVQDSIKAEFVDELVARAKQIRLGGPFDDKAETGALISAGHRDKVEAYVDRAREQGATVRCGGARPDDPSLAEGYFYLPTILDDCTRDMDARAGRVLRPGADGRVLHRRGRRGARSPTTASTAWPARSGPRTPARPSGSRARLRMGTVWINDYHPYVPQAEWGGYKQSGFGRELGGTGIEEYRETKHIWHNVQPEVQHWFGGA